MKYWVQFLTESTGYIEGTIPPKFGKPQLIDACGDTGVFILDGRNSEETMIRDAKRQAQRMQHWKQYKGFQLVTGPRLFEESRRSQVYPLTYPIQTN